MIEEMDEGITRWIRNWIFFERERERERVFCILYVCVIFRYFYYWCQYPLLFLLFSTRNHTSISLSPSYTKQQTYFGFTSAPWASGRTVCTATSSRNSRSARGRGVSYAFSPLMARSPREFLNSF